MDKELQKEIKNYVKNCYYMSKVFWKDGKKYKEEQPMMKIYLRRRTKVKSYEFNTRIWLNPSDSYHVEWFINEEKNIFRNLKYQNVKRLRELLYDNCLVSSNGRKSVLIKKLLLL